MLRKPFKSFAFLALLAMCILACDRELIEGPVYPEGRDYVPFSIGDIRLYTVHEIRYNFTGGNDTLDYEMKEEVVNAFLNQESDTTFLVHRLSRYSPSSAWQLDSVVQYTPSSQRLLVTANNKAVVQLVFPVKEGQSWDSNQLNTSAPDSFLIHSVGAAYVVADTTYPRTFQLLEEDLPDPIVRNIRRLAVYAEGAGLIYREDKLLNYCNTENCLGQGIITSGYDRKMWLKE
jgi:hypothetical protein